MDWEITQDRFIAFFDILGFKDFIYRNSHDVVLEKMKYLPIILSDIEEDAHNKLDKNDCEGIIRPVVFSDSIMLISNDKSIIDLLNLLKCCYWILKNSIQINIPIKGAISSGILTADFNKSLFFGRPLVDAYLLQESMIYYGCIMDNNVEDFFKKNITGSPQKWLIQYRTPFKTASVNHYNLNWLEIHIECNSNTNLLVENKEKEILNFYKTVSGPTRLYVDHTIEFFEFCKKHH